MTGTSRSARRYARAVFELATEEGQVEEWGHRLATVRDLLSDRTVVAVLTNPTIPLSRRMELISGGSDGDTGLDPEATNLARLLIESNRVEEVGGVVEEFETLADAAAGRVRATVTTAVELDDAERDRVADQLSERLGKEVRMTVVVDQRILGGLKLQYGDHLIDASVATKLQQLRRRLADQS
ncbi:MAG: F0F1 ATP synthase subunit delta [Candidatus Dormibacteraeota bacterium]|nr:F0F1 ATP synthase subunit delta [Candidatus Dormibacteraeota bacterium]